MKQKRELHNEDGSKEISIMLDPANTLQHIWNEVEFTVSKIQWKRICDASAGYFGYWFTEKGAKIFFSVPGKVGRCATPGRE
jgi:hypothetical protein